MRFLSNTVTSRLILLSEVRVMTASPVDSGDSGRSGELN